MRTREEHLEFCKKRAHEYLARGDGKNAITSMLSDLNKHPETKLREGSPLVALGMTILISGADYNQVASFIDGFR